jgi:ubiquinone/menaquinone biosynthesis C-methylase UbiE
MNEFDLKASEWDMNPMHWDRSAAIANEIKSLIPLTNEMIALEYGAGTGIASFLLKDHLKEITLMDSSAEMVRITEEKIKSTGVTNLKAMKFDLEHESYNNGKIDLIFTQMVLHHIEDIDSIIKKFRGLLKKGGYLAIADLYEEDGSFHGDGFTGHKGFNLEKMAGIIENNSFGKIIHKTCFVIERRISETESKQYEVFIIVSKAI